MYNYVNEKSKNIIINLLIYFFIAIVPFAKLISINLLSYLVFAGIIVFIVFRQWQETVYLLFGLCLFEFDLEISWWVLIAVAIIKLLFVKFKFKINIILYLIVLLAIEIMHANISSYLFVVTYFCLIISLSDSDSFDKEQFCRVLNFAFLCAVIAITKSEGSFENVVQAFESSSIIRIGESTTIASGTMGLTLGVILVIGLNFVTFIQKQHTISKMEYIFRLVISLFALFIGILTMSRIFLISIAILIFVLLLLLLKRKENTFRFIFCFVILSVFLMIYYNDIITTYFIKLSLRSLEDSGIGIRGLIWRNCYNYLNANPKGWIYGFGSLYSENIGVANNFLFQYMAHNLIIDTVMTCGILGFIIIICLSKVAVYNFSYSIDKVSLSTNNIVCAVPLIIYLIYGMTALSLTNLKTWLIWFVCLYYFSGTRRNNE